MISNEKITHEGPNFSSPEEEIEYLQARIAEKEKELGRFGVEKPKEIATAETIHEYKTVEPEKVLRGEYITPKEEQDRIALHLAPEEHDKKMDELVQLLQEKGIKNTISVVRAMKNPHIDDDFHRLLVQYIHNFPVRGLKEKTPLSRVLKMTLFEVVLPAATEESRQKNLKELISGMEHFYAGLLAEDERDSHFAIELAVRNVGEEVSFYVAVPARKKELFEKQLLAVFPGARIDEIRDDYNIFNENGVSVASYAVARESAYPLKTYDTFDHDPLSVILNAFSKLAEEGEGAAIQLLFRPTEKNLPNRYRRAIKEIEGGMSAREALRVSLSFSSDFFHEFKSLFGSQKPAEPEGSPSELNKLAIEHIKEKISSRLADTNIRIVASAPDKERAEDILFALESAFHQFESAQGNTLTFKRAARADLQVLLHDLSYRLFVSSRAIPLNLKELATLIHFPVRDMSGEREIKQAKAGTAPAPVGVAKSGLLMGENVHRGMQVPIYLTLEDRMRHMYIIGQTGTGKTSLLKNMIIQDIQNGEGVCMIDPHGSDVQNVLAHVPPERYQDVIYFDPSYTDRPMGLNMLEYDTRYPEQKTFVVNELLGIFNKLFDMKVAGGPMFEQYFRNSAMLVLEDPLSGNTLLEISRVLADESFRKLKLSRCRNPIVKQYWEEIAQKAGGEAALANIVPYITSKFDVFLSNDIMRPIIAQEHSSFNFRNIMDNKKILLVNLSKGRLGDINANLIGLILVGKILMAALSRVDSLGSDLAPFYLYIDEFQNITTDSISTILSEARKYKLGLNVAHQFIAQLDERIRDSIFGNVGSMAVYRVGAEDAEFLEKQFAPVFSARDIMGLDNYNYYAKFLMNGQTVKPFSVRALPPTPGDTSKLEDLKQLSYLTYGRPKEEIEREIMMKYMAAKKPAAPAPVSQ